MDINKQQDGCPNGRHNNAAVVPSLQCNVIIMSKHYDLITVPFQYFGQE